MSHWFLLQSDFFIVAPLGPMFIPVGSFGNVLILEATGGGFQDVAPLVI